MAREELDSSAKSRTRTHTLSPALTAFGPATRRAATSHSRAPAPHTPRRITHARRERAATDDGSVQLRRLHWVRA